ncbi:MAG: GNAT family N-acetyltransferase [Cyanosarcina radialis HA8281-LM2]|nr:GNAT family N-acetyltransferase [Cyanosarcina radialis HA8281-LM2]
MKNYDLVKLERSQIAYASEIAANAFADDPVFSYLMPADKRSRLQGLTWLTSKVIEYCLTCDRVYTTSDLRGVAAWLPPDRSSTNGLQLLQMAIQFQLYLLPWKCGWYRLGRWLTYLRAIEQCHHQDMTNRPHWYLALMVVHPNSQGQGIGSALLQPVLDRASREGLPCYLVTFTEQAVHFYQKNGFEVARKQKFSGDSPVFWTLKREP